MEIEKAENVISDHYLKIVAILITLIAATYSINSKWREQVLFNETQNISYAKILLEKRLELMREYHEQLENAFDITGSKFPVIDEFKKNIPNQSIIALYKISDNYHALRSFNRIVNIIKQYNINIPINYLSDENYPNSTDGTNMHCKMNNIDILGFQTPSIFILDRNGVILKSYKVTGREDAEILQLINNMLINDIRSFINKNYRDQ